MSLPPDDAWLDAFDPAELDDPDLEAVDEVVDRLVRGHRPAPRSRGPVVGAAVALALAAGLLLGLWLPRPGPTAAPVTSPEVAAAPAPALPSPAPATPAAPEVAAAPPAEAPPVAAPPAAALDPEALPAPVAGAAPAVAAAAPLGSPTGIAAPSPLGSPAPTGIAPSRVPRPPGHALPGLVPRRGSEFSVAGETAVLASGLLDYTHDERHDPGVTRIRWRDLPLVARPVGTAFTAASGPNLASIAVREGRVVLEHLDGSVLASLAPGDEITVVGDPRSPLDLRLLDTHGRPLDQVRALADADCRCRPEDLVALVASIRLAGSPAGLPIGLPEEP